MTDSTSKTLRRIVLRWVWASTLLVGGSSCANQANEPTPAPGITLVAGGSIKDTAFAAIASPVTVLVRRAHGEPAVGVAVRFAGAALKPGSVLAWAYFGTTASFNPTFDPAIVTTDENGRAFAFIHLGTSAGQGQFVIDVETLALHDTVGVTILAANPVATAIEPRDTAVYVGASYQLRAYLEDQWGNKTDTVATFSEVSSGIVVAGNRVTGQAIGRAALTATIRATSTLVQVSVVPVGTIAAHLARFIVGDSLWVATVNLDGSGFQRRVVESPPRLYGGEEPPEHELAPQWYPNGQSIIYHENQARSSGSVAGFDQRRLMVVGPDGKTRPLLDPSLLYSEDYPIFGTDSTWIYFGARAAADQSHRIARVHPDGSGLEFLTPRSFPARGHPAPSPDGSAVAFVDDWSGSQPSVRLLSLASGAVTSVASLGVAPRWSPQGDWIAYVVCYDRSGYAGPLHIVRPDGREDRIVGAHAYAPGFDWSPDGRYLIAGRPGLNGLELLDVTTDEAILLPYSEHLSQPAWRPGDHR